MNLEKKSLAIIGSGIAGLSAARQLRNFYDITIFEKAPFWGGHAYTFPAKFNKKNYHFDLGVQIFRPDIYPNLFSFCQDPEFSELSILGTGISLFSVYEQKGKRKVWGNTHEYLRLPEVNSIWEKQLRAECSRFMIEVTKFNEEDQLFVMKEWLQENHFSDLFKNLILIPSLSIVNVTRNGLLNGTFLSTLELPEILISFFSANTWYGFKNGIRSFLEIWAHKIQDKIQTNSTVLQCIPQASGKVKLRTKKNNSNEIIEHLFDQVLFANDLTDARSILAHKENPYQEKQQSLLQAFKSENAFVYLHQDPSTLPANIPLTSSALFHHKEDELIMHYNLDVIQGNYGQTGSFVSLFSEKPSQEPTKLLRDPIPWKHPCYSPEYFEAQLQMHQIQGLGNIWFCGNNTVIDGFEASMLSGFIIAEKIRKEAKYPFHEPTNQLEGRAYEVFKMFRDRLMFPEETLSTSIKTETVPSF